MTRLLPLLLLAAACGGKEAPGDGMAPGQESQGIVGEWVGDGGATTLVLDEHDAFILDTKAGQHLTGTWVFDDPVLSMTGGGEDAMARAFTGTLKGDVLRLRMRPKTVQLRRR